MRLPSARSNRIARKLRLRVELLESRLAPAVVGVDAGANVHAIDPNVYGSAFATTAQLADLHLPLNRDGGNASDTYSFAQDATNHGSDWYFESIASGSGNGQGMDQFVSDSQAGGAQPSITLNLFDWAAKLGVNRSILGSFPVATYGPQQSTDPWRPDLGNGVHTNGTNITGNDPNIAYVANSPTTERAWIQHLISTFGDSQNGGVKYYTMGNEPALWNSTHRDIHPAGETNTELLNDIINYASMVKSLDPGAQILGPEEWGWTGYFIDGADAATQNWGATYGGLNVQQWLLQQLHQYDTANGTRLLDYFTLHFYPQGGQFSDDVSTNMELLRNRSTRSLWDPNYVDESWIASTGINGGKVNLINMMKSWVNTYYPGTKIGVTEYNWGAEGNMNGATTQADIWGIFGREGLDLANRWTTPATNSPTYLAMKMYRNYDGGGSAFGGTSVAASVANPDQVSAFASVRSSDGALTVMVVNKNLFDPANPSATTSVTVNLSNFVNAGVAQEWQLAAVNPTNQNNAAIAHLSNVNFSGNSFTINVPMESLSMFVIQPASSVPSAPAGLTATPGDGKVTLSWNASAGATSYNVYRGTTSGGETLLQSGVTATTYADPGLTNGTTYFYRVTAVNGVGEGAMSAEVSATPQVAAPTNLTATAVSASQIDLTWTDNSAGETGFVLERATDSTFTTGLTTVNLGANVTAYSATGLATSTTYWFRVRAVDAGSTSADSNVASATTQSGSGGGTGLAATYFDNMNFTGATVSQVDPMVNFDWGTGSPVTGIDADTFSVRWRGQIQAIESGQYRFRTLSDDGVRLWVNGRLVIDHWASHTLMADTSAAVTLVAGKRYAIRMTYYESRGVAVAKLLWRRPGQPAFEAIPQAQLYAQAAPGDGLAATYYDNIDFTGGTVSRVDPTVNFNWGLGPPASGIGPDTFSARWTGQVMAVETGTYTFRTNSDEGVRLWVDGRLIIDDWTAHGAKLDTGTITLEAGRKYDIKIEYYDKVGSAVMKLAWKRPGQTGFAIVPQEFLYSGGV
jgi:Glycoside hydrolase family 44/PA14 domain/Fibronectin type III domain